jgi:hypothetical protein
MKKVILFSFLIMGSALSYAQRAQSADAFYNTPYDTRNSGSFSLSTGILSLGYGLSNNAVNGYNYISGFNGSSRASFGPVYLKYEHGIIRDEIGLGGQMAFSHTWIRYDNASGRYRDNVGAFSLGVLGYYHFNKLIPVPNLDVYAGTGLSIRTLSYHYDSDLTANPTDHSTTNVYVTGRVGARYYVTRSFGFYAEVGYDNMSDINLGISFKFL